MFIYKREATLFHLMRIFMRKCVLCTRETATRFLALGRDSLMTGEPILPEDLDLNDIFIGRERQLHEFRNYLESWLRSLPLSSTIPLTLPPSPHMKLQGFFVFLHERGGLGKSTLLKH